MATHVAPTSENGRPRRLALRSTPVQLLGALATAALALLGGMLASTPAAAAAKICGERTEILQRLEQRHDETPRALGLSSDGGVVEVLVSPEGGWTILVSYPDRPTCVVAVGEAWQPLTLIGQPA